MPPGGRESRDDYKKRKEIEEARKAGTLPPEMDNSGNMINPHIPEYMSKAPWYLNQEEGEGLKHQRYALENKKRYDSLRVVKQKGFTYRSKKFRKGACKNCGAVTHDAKSCVEAPRKRGASVTGSNIMPDEVVPDELSLTWDGKRDRWAGYNIDEHKKTIEMYRLAEETRQKRKKISRDKKGKDTGRAETKRLKKKEHSDQDSDDTDDSDSDSDSDTDTDTDDSDDDDRMGQHEEGQFESKHATRQKCSVRNLRIREDLPKYLRNLDPNSAHYDPKTRSMRANPNPHIPLDQSSYAGDNYVRLNGDSHRLAATQVFAWEAYSRGVDVNMQADPTTAAVMQKITKKRKEDLELKKKQGITDKYGDQSGFKAPDRSLLLGETEMMLTYTKDGRRVDGKGSKVVPKTKYEEDQYLNNHTCVWGSWYEKDTRQWGYGCCHQSVKRAYCTGEAGKRAHAKSKSLARLRVAAPGQAAEEKAAEGTAAGKGKGKGKGKGSAVEESNKALLKKQLYGYDENSKLALDPSKLKAAVRKQKELQKSNVDDGRKRKYHSLKLDDEVTAEDMEAYRMTKMRDDDPMAKFINKDVDSGAEADDGDDADDDGETKITHQQRKRERKKRKKKRKKKS